MTAEEFDLRFAVLTRPSGRVELRYFRSPQDCEGVTMRLTADERDRLVFAFATPGFHAIARDDAPDLQILLPLEPVKKRRKAA